MLGMSIKVTLAVFKRFIILMEVIEMLSPGKM